MSRRRRLLLAVGGLAPWAGTALGGGPAAAGGAGSGAGGGGGAGQGLAYGAGPGRAQGPGAGADPGRGPGPGPGPRIAPPARPAPPLAEGLPIRLPRDFGAHPAWRQEWWYLTGWLTPAGAPAEAAPWGFQLTFFRRRGGLDPAEPSRFAGHQLLAAHAALSPPPGTGGGLLQAEKVARAGFGLAEAAEGDTDLRLLGWRLRREPGPGGPDAPLGHGYRAEAAAEGWALALDARATQPVLAQGLGGWSRKGPAPSQASLYLSEPQLVVRGQLQAQGRRLAVEGRAWLDHEWSEQLLAPEAVGWDWLGLNLEDGGAFTAFRLRDAAGRSLWAGGSHRPAPGQPPLPPPAAAPDRRTDAPGRTAPPPQPGLRVFGPGELAWTPGRRWRSPRSGADYPVAWTLESPLGRHRIVPARDDQEVDGRASTGAAYWEGLVALEDEAGRRLGRGYLEMTGYAAPLKL